ncbi:MAG: hypothetical protein QXR02_01490 [Acidilobaceae archaeon]
MSSELEEETIEEGVELVERRRGEEEVETIEVEGEHLEPESAMPLYDVTRPELLDTMITAVEILTQTVDGRIGLNEAVKMYSKEVEERLKKLLSEGVIVKKVKTRKRKTKTTKREAKRETRGRVKKKAKRKTKKEEVGT